MDEARVFPVRVNGAATTVFLSADELVEAAEQGRLLIVPAAEGEGMCEAADDANTETGEDVDRYDHSVPPICDRIREIVSRVPPEAWDSLPEDLSDNLDHYIYGTPKE